MLYTFSDMSYLPNTLSCFLAASISRTGLTFAIVLVLFVALFEAAPSIRRTRLLLVGVVCAAEVAGPIRFHLTGQGLVEFGLFKYAGHLLHSFF